MRLLQLTKDGGRESRVWAYTLIELKSWFSVIVLRFEDGSRDAYHSHAFNAWSWVLKGELNEHVRTEWPENHFFWRRYLPSWRPIFTARETFHQVRSVGRSGAITFRGPWAPTWRDQAAGEPVRTLTHGRREVEPEGLFPEPAVACG